jgi:glycosyltransferase involved in cell wall biosynthesis
MSPAVSRPPVIFVLVQTDVSADGGVSSISQIIARLRDHRPIVVTDRETSRTEQWRSAGIETHVVPQVASRGFSREPLKVLASYARYARALRKLIKTSGAKVVHANDPAALQLAIVPAKLTGTKLVFSLRGTFDPAHPPSRFKYRMLFAAVDRVLYLSHDMAHRWQEHVPNAAASCSVTYSAVDPARFRPSPVDADGDAVVLVSGLIRPLKGQLEFIENVAPELAAQGVKVQFAGDFDPASDAYMAACARAASPLKAMVEFLGYRPDVPELMARSTVIAVPSRHEGMVRAMIEGMSCARPVVSFDVCSAREIVEQEAGGAGMVVDCGDYAAMARAILSFCRDRAAAAEAGKKGHAAAQRLFAPDEVVARYERAYAMLETAQ